MGLVMHSLKLPNLINNLKLQQLTQTIFRTAKELATVNNRDQISHLIAVLTRDFVNSRSPHAKKGGLIGLASVAIGLRDVSLIPRVTLFLNALPSPCV